MRKQKTLVVLFAIAIGIVSCAPSNENVVLRNPDNEALVKKYMEAIVSGDTSNLEGFLADNYQSLGPNFNDSINKTRTVEDIKASWRSRWRSVEYKRYTMLSATNTEPGVEGDWVLDWAAVTIHSKDKTPSFTINWHGAFRVKDGKIDREIDFFNEADIYKQIGFTFVPPADSAAAVK